MANELILHIDLSKIDTKEENAKEKLQEATNSSSGKNKLDKVQRTDDNLMKAAKTVGAVALTKQVVNSGISYAKYRVNTIGARYGDTARQNEINNALNLVETGLSIGGSITAGAMVGGPVGAAIGLISGLIPQVLSAIERVDQWKIKQDENNVREVRSAERLGLLSTDRNRGI